MMMANSLNMPGLSAAQPSARSMRGFAATPAAMSAAAKARVSRSHRLQASPSRRWVDLAGRPVRLSPAVPGGFDAPLAAHHKLIGRWVDHHAPAAGPLTRAEARRHIEQAFQREVLGILGGNTLADLRVIALAGNDDLGPPAIAIICDSVGQIDLGWIEQTNVLANTLKGSVAPVGWRAAAYQALHQIAAVLPIFSFAEMMEELSAYYWDGETEDEPARHALVTFHGQDLEDMVLPSQIRVKRPDYMLAGNADPMKALPPVLRAKLCRLTAAWNAVQGHKSAADAWHIDACQVYEYLPEYEDTAPMAPMTLVPFDDFAEQLDLIGQYGMEHGFFNIAGFCPLTGPDVLAQWFASLRLGAELLAAAQDLIDLDVAKVRP